MTAPSCRERRSRSLAVSVVALAALAIAALVAPAPARAEVSSPAPSGDDAMTCEQIAMELSTYAQAIVPNIQALAASQAQLNAQAQEKGRQRMVEDTLLLPLAQAGAMDPTGAAKRAYQAAVVAQAAKQRAESEALANTPLAKQNKAQGEQVAAQAEQMRSDARLQHLLQLGQDEHCDKH